MSQDAVEAAVRAICDYLQLQESLPDAPVDEWGDKMHHEDARTWCRRILQAAGADGLGGCRLCQS